MTDTVSGSAVNSGLDDSDPGLWRRTYDDGVSVLTNIRMAGEGRKRGSLLINAATALLLILAIALYVVSINAQFTYVMNVKHDDLVSWIEAASLDGGMAIFTLLALGLARAGQSARIERLAIVACAIGSAVMNYAAASAVDVRSELAYTIPPLFLAGVVDRTVSVVRRHYLGDEDASAWSNLGRISLYVLRLVLAPPSTVMGLRRVVLIATPLPDAPEKPEEQKAIASAVEVPLPRRTRKRGARKTGKTRAFLDHVAAEYGHGHIRNIKLDKVYTISESCAPKFDLHPGSARNALRRAILSARGEI